jgi:hypothetical protein
MLMFVVGPIDKTTDKHHDRKNDVFDRQRGSFSKEDFVVVSYLSHGLPLFMVGCWYFIHHPARYDPSTIEKQPLFTQTNLQRIGVKQNTNRGRKQ